MDKGSASQPMDTSAELSRPKFTDLPIAEQKKGSIMLADQLFAIGAFGENVSRDDAIEQCHHQLATLSDDFFELPQALFDLSDEELGQVILDLVNNPDQA
jgi:hypothetical protein